MSNKMQAQAKLDAYRQLQCQVRSPANGSSCQTPSTGTDRFDFNTSWLFFGVVQDIIANIMCVTTKSVMLEIFPHRR